MSETDENPAANAPVEDLNATRELLGRARSYLDRCRKHPQDALDDEDPGALLQELTEALEAVHNPDQAPAPEAKEPDPAPETPGTIRRIHRRRSA